VLVTANTEDFSRFNGIRIQDWTRRIRRREARGMVAS
jgi:hypothetical protein